MNWAVIFVVIAIFFAVAIVAGLKVQKKKVTTGLDGMTGLEGKVVKRLNPEGDIYVHGEIWHAVSVSGIAVSRGESVTVESVSGNMLMVRRKEKQEVS